MFGDIKIEKNSTKKSGGKRIFHLIKKLVGKNIFSLLRKAICVDVFPIYILIMDDINDLTRLIWQFPINQRTVFLVFLQCKRIELLSLRLNLQSVGDRVGKWKTLCTIFLQSYNSSKTKTKTKGKKQMQPISLCTKNPIQIKKRSNKLFL